MIKKVTKTFSERALDFYSRIQTPNLTRFSVKIINPFQNENSREYVKRFYKKFYSDSRKRIFVFGINPGRFGSGITGVPFTDPVALEKYCGIGNDLQKRKEMSSEFVYKCISAFGGSEKFFGQFYLTALSPVGFTKRGTNYNYYDDPDFLKCTRPFLVASIKDQIGFGADMNAVIIFGSGKNSKVFEDINKEHGFFHNIYVLEHPRYVMQYKRKDIVKYISKYMDTFERALRLK